MSPAPTPPEVRLLIRADTRPGVGTGHAMRQLALVERWRRSGPVTIVLDAPASELVDRFGAAGADVVAVGPTWGPDDCGGADIVVLDGYAFGPDLQGAIRGRVPLVAVVDDHGHHGRYEADVVVDPNLGARRAAHDRRPVGAALLQGPRFALLRAEFDGDGTTEPAVDPRVVVLLGGGHEHAAERLADAVAARFSERPVEVTTPTRAGRVADVAGLLRSASVVVSAAGTTAWELARLGRPAVLVSVADNQEPVGRALADAGAARYLGPWSDDDAATAAVAAVVEELLDDDGQRSVLSGAGRALVDGRGAARIATELLSATVTLRDVETADARLLLAWANDPAVRAASFSGDPIDEEEHRDWMKRRLADPGADSYLAIADGEPWGQIRFDRGEDGCHEVGVSVAAEARGAGRAGALIRAGVRRLFATTGASSVQARIKADNERSTAAFLDADFTVETEASAGGPWSLSYDRGRDGRA